MALVTRTDAPLTDVAGVSDNTLTAAAIGAAGGIGIGTCLGLAPANIIGVAITAGALLCASNRK